MSFQPINRLQCFRIYSYLLLFSIFFLFVNFLMLYIFSVENPHTDGWDMPVILALRNPSKEAGLSWVPSSYWQYREFQFIQGSRVILSFSENRSERKLNRNIYPFFFFHTHTHKISPAISKCVYSVNINMGIH